MSFHEIVFPFISSTYSSSPRSDISLSFWKIKTTETLGYAYVYMYMRMHAQALRAHALCMRMHTRACVRMLGFQKPKKKGFLH